MADSRKSGKGKDAPNATWAGRQAFVFGARAAAGGNRQGPASSVAREKAVPGPGAPGAGAAAAKLGETVKALVRVAREQGRLMWEDVSELLPEELSAEDLEEVHGQLEKLGIEVSAGEEQEEKPKASEEEWEAPRLGALDDPLRQYMRQMGRAPLLSREQEVEVCQRIERGETEFKGLVYSLGFAAKEHCALAEKLLAEPPRERFDRLVAEQKVGSREKHLAMLRTLVNKVRALDARADELYAQWQQASGAARQAKGLAELRKQEKKLQAELPKFQYKPQDNKFRGRGGGGHRGRWA